MSNEVIDKFEELIKTLYSNRPSDRSDIDRVYAVAITDVQKAYAWFKVYAFVEKDK